MERQSMKQKTKKHTYEESHLSMPATEIETAEYEKRATLYTELLAYYIHSNQKKAARNRIYKGIFFCLIMLFLMAAISTPIILVVFLLQNETSNLVAELATVISAFAGMISAILILPKIIAQHLFPADEDEHMIELVKNMQANDSKIRDTVKKTSSK